MQACEHLKENLTLYVYGELDPVSGREVENHLAVCEGCRHEHRRLSTILAKVKEASAVLDQLAYEKYPQLSVDEIKTLVVDDKWLAALSEAVQGELERVSQTLTGRVRQLAERYATPLPQLTERVAELSARVDEHLKKMGAVWA